MEEESGYFRILFLLMFYLIKPILKTFTQPSVPQLTKNIDDNTELEISHCRINIVDNQKTSISALFYKEPAVKMA